MTMARAWSVSIGVLATAIFLIPVTAAAQGAFAIGPRLSFAKGAEESPDGSQRFSGGVIRLGSGKTALELAMDYRSGLTGDLTERIKDYPIQISTLLFPVRGRVAPYVLGGVGWYSQRVQRITGVGDSATVVDDQTSRVRGYHAGFGSEVRLHRRIGIYGDYRYTFLGFGDDDDTPSESTGPSALQLLPSLPSLPDRVRMSHQGRQITWGLNFYF
jgi:hypothetical protein